jgi:hypothetical protein
MKTSYAFIVLATLWAAPASFGASPAAGLDSGTAVTLRLKQPLSSETAHVNDRVEFEVAEDVVSAGSVVIAHGAAAWGKVADAAPSGRLMRNGRLAVDIESVALVDGTTVRLRAPGPAGSNPGRPAEDTADTLGALPALPFTVFRYGKAIEIPAGKMVTVYTAAPVTLGSGEQSPRVPAAPIPAPPVNGAVLPSLKPAPGNDRATQSATAPAPVPAGRNFIASGTAAPPPALPVAAGGVLPSLSSAPAITVPDRITGARTSTAQASIPSGREPVSIKRGYSKKLLIFVAAGAAIAVASVLAAKAHGGSQSAAAATGIGATSPPTTVGLGPITVGGPN